MFSRSRRWPLLVALVLAAVPPRVHALPTITTITVQQPVLDGFEFEPELDFSWPPNSLPSAGAAPALDRGLCVPVLTLTRCRMTQRLPPVLVAGSCERRGPKKCRNTVLLHVVPVVQCTVLGAICRPRYMCNVDRQMAQHMTAVCSASPALMASPPLYRDASETVTSIAISPPQVTAAPVVALALHHSRLRDLHPPSHS